MVRKTDSQQTVFCVEDGAGEIIRNLLFGGLIAESIKFILKFDIAQLLEDSDGSNDYVADKIGCDSDRLYRLLKALSSVGIFQEIRHRVFEHTAVSLSLKYPYNKDFYPLANFRSSLFNYELWADIETVMFDQNAQDLGYGGIFHNDYLLADFIQAMSHVAQDLGDNLIKIEGLFETARSVLDIGGGDGTTLGIILQKYPYCLGGVLEIDSVIQHTRMKMDRLGFSSRCDLHTGDYLSSIPRGYDIHVLQLVLHNCDDNKALQILKNSYSSNCVGGKVYIIEAVNRNGQIPESRLWSDVQMMLLFNGKERTLVDYQDLLQKSRYQFSRFIPVTKTIGLIEAVKGSSIH